MVNNFNTTEVNPDIQTPAAEGTARRPWNAPRLSQRWHAPVLTPLKAGQTMNSPDYARFYDGPAFSYTS
jgi:hypothetical protein